VSEYLIDKLGVPLLITAIFAFLSGGWTVLVGGATPRMKRVWICSVTFIFAVGEAMAWHKELTAITGAENAWIVLSAFFFAAAIWLYKILRRQSAANTE
jgi:hypothetical protein